MEIKTRVFVSNDKDLVICYETTVRIDAWTRLVVQKKQAHVQPLFSAKAQPELQPDARLFSLCICRSSCQTDQMSH